MITRNRQEETVMIEFEAADLIGIGLFLHGYNQSEKKILAAFKFAIAQHQKATGIVTGEHGLAEAVGSALEKIQKYVQASCKLAAGPIEKI